MKVSSSSSYTTCHDYSECIKGIYVTGIVEMGPPRQSLCLLRKF
uniref:Uncharacterized protein n=1 Tax=Rhizophora mucronata TaxID=61149 RepID=A0A2P2IUL5_RHIMU